MDEFYNISNDTQEIKNESTEKKGFLKSLSKAKKIILCVLAALLVIVLLTAGLLLAEINGKNLKASVSVDIPKGSASVSIAEILKDNKIIGNTFIFRVYSKLNGFDGQFKYGTYTFKGKNSYFDICQRLISEGEVAKSITVTIPEGTSIKDYTKDVNGEKVTVAGIATILERAGVCTANDFYEALNNVSFEDKLLSNANRETAYLALEGYLFPDTYDFYCYDSKECARLAVEKMIAQSEKMITDEMYARADKLGYSMNEILTLASIIQLESGQSTNEMPNVAAVFYNRLGVSKSSTLGSSPTCYYGNAFSFDDGRYDTYKVKGLPPGPLCSPGIDAVKAVLWPTANSPYHYFVTDKNGKFYYHKTYAEQQKTVAALQNEGNWIYEYLD